MADRWADGEAYERYIGRWSRIVARRFIEWLAPQPGLSWHDVGSGTGALTATILELAAPASVVGVEPSEAFADAARASVTDSRVLFLNGTAEQLPMERSSVDAAVSGLVMNFVPDINAALAEQIRVVRPGGWVAGYVWDYADGMQLIRRFWDAAVALDPDARRLDEGVRFPITQSGPLEAAWQAAGLSDVMLIAIDVPTRFTDFDELWAPFESGVGPAPAYAAALPPDHRTRLRDHLSRLVPAGPDGSITLNARAWAVRGVVTSGRNRSL